MEYLKKVEKQIFEESSKAQMKKSRKANILEKHKIVYIRESIE